MEYGFVKIAALAPAVRAADCAHNAAVLAAEVKKAAADGAELVVLPRLCLSGSSCGDLFRQKTLQNGALSALKTLVSETEKCGCAVIAGLPLFAAGRLCDCAAVICGGKILGIVTRAADGIFENAESATLNIGGECVPFGAELAFRCENMPDFCFAVGENLAPISIIPAAETECGTDDGRRRTLSAAKSAGCAYIFCNSGAESTAEGVFAGTRLIFEDCALLAEAKPFEDGALFADLDTEYLSRTYRGGRGREIFFSLKPKKTVLTRKINPDPFLGTDGVCEKTLEIQARGLAGRLAHTGARKAVLGISGGLDSALALLVSVRAMELCGKSAEDIYAVTMPCFGTTERTRGNAEKLCEQLGVPLRSINISDAVRRHFDDIGHSTEVHDTAFENAQARERTQVLMDIANMINGLVVGTGDLSELALGWATYNGDHMSAYSVNASVPKTLIRHIIRHYAEKSGGELAEILLDIAATPVSPELLPAAAESSPQKTEDIVGPYELHDFFIYNMIKNGFSPEKLQFLAEQAFAGVYDGAVIKKWLAVFLRRFFSQQFKRSCMPDGPAATEISLSPRSGFSMPSDICGALWTNK